MLDSLATLKCSKTDRHASRLAIRSPFAFQNSMSINHYAQRIKTDRHFQYYRGHRNALKLPRWLNISYHSHDNLTLNTDPKDLFNYLTFHSRILSPEVVAGQFCIKSEYIRHVMCENEPGVPFRLYTRILDTLTCEPVLSRTLSKLGVSSFFMERTKVRK